MLNIGGGVVLRLYRGVRISGNEPRPEGNPGKLHFQASGLAGRRVAVSIMETHFMIVLSSRQKFKGRSSEFSF